MTRAGVPRSIAKQISGHMTDAVFERYDIVDEEDIRQGLLKTQAYISQNERGKISFYPRVGQKTDSKKE